VNVHSELDRLLQSGPFHAALRAAIQARGLALHRLRHRLAQQGVQVGVTSLSYWQHGTRRPARRESLRAVAALDQVLELPDGSLVRLLDDGPQPERRRARPYRKLMDAAGPLHEVLARLQQTDGGGLHTVTQLERVTIGARRELVGRASQQVVRAHRGGVDRYVAIHHGDAGCDAERVLLRAGDNCRVGRVARHAGAGIVAGELLFDTRLGSGETHLFSYAFLDGTGGPSSEFVRAFPFGSGQYVLEVRFDEAALPVHCHRFHRAAAGGRSTRRHALTLTGRHRSVHLVEQGPQRPGIVGIDWEWA
jgi:hypothetical protein